MFKDKTCLALLLFIVIIAFSVISEYNLSTMLNTIAKPLQQSKENFDDAVPSCNYGDDVPACYSTIVDDDTLYNYNHYDDNYILKTEVVPPVCPACPSLINGHSHEENVGENTEILGTEQVDAASGDINVLSQSQTSSVEETSNTNTNNTSNTSNITNTNIYNQESPSNQDSAQAAQTESSQGGGLGSVLGSGQGSSSESSYQKEIERLKAELNKLKQSNGNGTNTDSCPPCPPCDRCPEPSFSCEKVLNYRSPNVGNYLPLPVLNDFSSFDAQ